MDTLFSSSTSFSSLSLKDLLWARDLFHYHLMSKKNVVATAIGLYRIRKTDPWPNDKHPGEVQTDTKKKVRRTLFNSEIRAYSWPCVYVFVREWVYEETLAASNPSDMVPKTLYLPDGRTVPVCIIEAKPQLYSKDLEVDTSRLPARNLLHPGGPLVNEDGQGLPRLATAGCIVRDSQRYFVLTNRHASGASGDIIKAAGDRNQPVIGHTAVKGLGREDFQEIYPDLPSTRQFLLMDIGLIDIADVRAWKTEIPGIAPIGNVLDLYDNSFSLQLLGRRITGLSAITGQLHGEIHALFYRYKSIGGSEYLADFIIGPQTHGVPREDEDLDAAFAVHHGDSGTLLLLEHREPTLQCPKDHRSPWQRLFQPDVQNSEYTTTYFPFAILWGREEFLSGGKGEPKAQPFALATAFSTVLNRLELDLVTDINSDEQFIWGWVGHYVIGGFLPTAVDLLRNRSLKSFITENLGLLTLTPDQALGNDPRVLEKGATGPNNPAFVPLADVPDNVWKSNVNDWYSPDPAGGRPHPHPGPGNRGQTDNPNHFADLDLPYKGSATFLKYCLANPKDAVNPDVWIDYYQSHMEEFLQWDLDALTPKKKAAVKAGTAKAPNNQAKHLGALVFRIWQLFNIMKDAAENKNANIFLLAGGVLIHYVGDACQPLHTSYLANGDPTTAEALGIHSKYEDDMVGYGYKLAGAGGLNTLIEKAIKSQQTDSHEKIAKLQTGQDVALAVIDLVAKTHETLPPRRILDAWTKIYVPRKRDLPALLWEELDNGKSTAVCMARGTRLLAAIWDAAWNLGRGDDNIPEKKLDPKQLQKLYSDSGNVPSIPLGKYRHELGL